jgi:hypothetical protein
MKRYRVVFRGGSGPECVRLYRWRWVAMLVGFWWSVCEPFGEAIVQERR